MKACEYLQKKKYKLIDVNYASRFGEIDLIMTKGEYICFIEVKNARRKFDCIADRICRFRKAT
ncbi:MAG: YraN family protein [Anaerotruncus sp.]|nr:MAG: YraN family protein [Anaerotruncus sp.]